MRSGDSRRAKMGGRKGGWDGSGAPLSYNRLRRVHLDALVVQLRALRLLTVDAPATFTFSWAEPDRHRDPDNIAAGGTKLVMDALVDAGVLPKDGAAYVAELHHGFRYDRGATGSGVHVAIQLPLVLQAFFLRGRLPDLNELLAARELGARRMMRRAGS